MRSGDLGFERGGTPLTGLQGFVGRVTWGCARRTCFTPGFHITGFQPSEEGMKIAARTECRALPTSHKTATAIHEGGGS
ncbi:hypothetical protein SBV1_590059 [Verrucomicrobia bacterium]|nr:hypothetical protein SBV1_590059 [Verrucomicrobiota bacterium]